MRHSVYWKSIHSGAAYVYKHSSNCRFRQQNNHLECWYCWGYYGNGVARCTFECIVELQWITVRCFLQRSQTEDCWSASWFNYTGVYGKCPFHLLLTGLTCFYLVLMLAVRYMEILLLIFLYIGMCMLSFLCRLDNAHDMFPDEQKISFSVWQTKIFPSLCPWTLLTSCWIKYNYAKW